MPNQHASEVSGTPEESDLLAELADLAAKKTQTEQTDEQKRLERSKNVHIALNRIYQYFSQFFEYLKAVKPATALSFPLDQRTAYSNIQWIEANADLRRQNLSDSALVDHVSLLIKLTAPDPVVITRRWNELETLKQELNDFGLRPVEDIYAQVRRQPQKEFVTIELAPDFSMRLQFQGNYEGGDIELLSNNFDGFGLASFVLDPTDVTHQLLDEIGRFLLGRNARLPEIITSTRFTPAYPIYR